MQNVFQFRNNLIEEYRSFSSSFTKIGVDDIATAVAKAYADGRYWPEPLIQINPNYKRGPTVAELVEEGTLHPGCATLFQVGKDGVNLSSLQLFKHQLEALANARQQRSYVVTTGTGSGCPRP